MLTVEPNMQGFKNGYIINAELYAHNMDVVEWRGEPGMKAISQEMMAASLWVLEALH